MSFGLTLSDWELSDRETQEVETHVVLAFLLCFEGVGEPGFGLFEFEPHALQPFLDGFFAPLDAFPGGMEDDKVVGIPDAMGDVVEPLPIDCPSLWSSGLSYHLL